MKRNILFILIISLMSAYTLSASEIMNYDKETRGLVRKIKVYQDPAWVAKVVTKEGKKAYFISSKSLLEFYYDPYKWPSMGIKDKDGIKDMYVTDYKTLKAIDAKYAFYVYGGRLISPAGDDLVTFKNIEDAKEYSKIHRGRRILSFNEVKKGLIQLLNGDI